MAQQPNMVALGEQLAEQVEIGQAIERCRLKGGSPRGPGGFQSLIEHQAGQTEASQAIGREQADRPRPHHQHIGYQSRWTFTAGQARTWMSRIASGHRVPFAG